MIHRRLRIGLLCLVLVSLAAGCNLSAQPPVVKETPQPGATIALPTVPGPTPAPGEVAVRVNGQPISRLDFEQQVARFQAAMISQGQSFSGTEGKPLAQQVRRQVLEAMIDELLIEQAAAAQGIVLSNEVLRQRIENDIQAGGGQEKFEKWLQMNHLSSAEYERMMRSQILTDEMIRRLSLTIPATAKQVHIRQILVESEAEAKDLRKRLDTGADFADLAKKFSRDEGSREQGGDRGFLPMGASVLAPEVESALAGLAPGKVAGPIASPYGYYLIQITEVEDNRPLAPEMLQGMTREAFITWIEAQRAKANIERLIDLNQ